MPADVLDEHQDLACPVGGERAAVHRAGLLVDRLVLAHLLHQVEQLRVRQAHVVAQLDLVDFVHQVAEHRTLAASGGDRALAQLARDALQRVRVVTATESVSQSTCTAAICSILDQPLVPQVADGERLGRMAERHQRDDLALVEIER